MELILYPESPNIEKHSGVKKIIDKSIYTFLFSGSVSPDPSSPRESRWAGACLGAEQGAGEGAVWWPQSITCSARCWGETAESCGNSAWTSRSSTCCDNRDTFSIFKQILDISKLTTNKSNNAYRKWLVLLVKDSSLMSISEMSQAFGYFRWYLQNVDGGD